MTGTQNRPAIPNVSKLVDSVELRILIPGIIDEREGLCRLINWLR